MELYKVKKRVMFVDKPHILIMHTWNFAYRMARIGKWEEKARDRERFQFRIAKLSEIITPILLHKQQKFSNITSEEDNVKK